MSFVCSNSLNAHIDATAAAAVGDLICNRRVGKQWVDSRIVVGQAIVFIEKSLPVQETRIDVDIKRHVGPTGATVGNGLVIFAEDNDAACGNKEWDLARIRESERSKL